MCASSNPYIQENKPPTLQRSVVAFIDILGYRDFVKSAAHTSKDQELLRCLHNALLKGREYIQPRELDPLFSKFTPYSFSLRAFTDNIVIGYPISNDGEVELGRIFNYLSYFQMTMIMEGFFIRGGIAIGNLYMDDITVYGSGLIEAYEAENTLAHNPRIVLAPSAQEAVDKHIGYYSPNILAPQNKNLLKDSDGQYFLDYLYTLIKENDSIYMEELTLHKEKIASKLIEYKDQPAIWSKYLWAANYHNFFCKHFPRVNEEMKVDFQDVLVTPTRIIERV